MSSWKCNDNISAAIRAETEGDQLTLRDSHIQWNTSLHLFSLGNTSLCFLSASPAFTKPYVFVDGEKNSHTDSKGNFISESSRFLRCFIELHWWSCLSDCVTQAKPDIVCTSCALRTSEESQISGPFCALSVISLTQPHARKHLRADYIYKRCISAWASLCVCMHSHA